MGKEKSRNHEGRLNNGLNTDTPLLVFCSTLKQLVYDSIDFTMN